MTDTGKTVLVVDDTAAQLDLITALLKPHYRVRVATTGERAIEVATSDPPPDLILLDLLMPGMTGREVLGVLSSDPRTFEIPVIIVSSADAEAVGDELKNAFTAALSKPVDADLLLDTVTRTLSA
jgi:putative two-component system response regulator